ncbi:hypothetical protein LEMLEM_LOCUS8276 [Lemmus lemmus]
MKGKDPYLFCFHRVGSLLKCLLLHLPKELGIGGQRSPLQNHPAVLICLVLLVVPGEVFQNSNRTLTTTLPRPSLCIAASLNSRFLVINPSVSTSLPTHEPWASRIELKPRIHCT